MAKHEHEFSGLWSHWGQFGRQDVHVHSCFDCDTVIVVGEGRNCDGKQETHHREVWRNGKWREVQA